MLNQNTEKKRDGCREPKQSKYADEQEKCDISVQKNVAFRLFVGIVGRKWGQWRRDVYPDGA